jgi:hypothetical protein
MQTLPYHGYAAVEIGAYPIHLVDEADPGNAVAICLPPDSFRLGFNAGHPVEHRHPSVEYPQASLYLGGEINVPWGIDDIDAVIQPVAGGGGGGDGYPSLSLLLHPVHYSRSRIHLTDLIGSPRAVKHPLGGSGLAGIYMGNDPDVSYSL